MSVAPSDENAVSAETVDALLIETADLGPSPLTPKSSEFLSARSRSYSTDFSTANGRGVSESTTSIQQMTISTAGEQFNNTTKVIGDATSVSFKTTTTTTTTITYGGSQDAEDMYKDCVDGGHADDVDQEVTTKQVTSIEITIGPQHFDLLKLLGTGAFGKVVLVQNRLSKELYAMKVISKKLLRKKNNVQYMKSERQILTKVKHPFLVGLKFAFQSETKLFLVMSFLSGGELFLHLRRRGLILEHEVEFYLGEMILAMEFLHHQGIIHRDLKPENVLLRHDGHICITDFGLAKEIGDGQSARTLCGTSEYMAPEMLTRTGYGKAVDWWALGALCYEMLVGKPPFTANNQKELDKKIMFEKFTVPSYLTANATSLLRGMLEKDPTKRLGCAKGNMFSIGGVAALKRHAFFDGLDWVALEHLELTPPIDLAKEHYPAASNTAGNSTTANGASGKGGKGGGGGGGGPVGGKGNKATAAVATAAATRSPAAAAAMKAGPDDDDDDLRFDGGSGGALDVDTRFFSEEFTTQVLSPSLLEDTFSTHEQTPVRHRSRAGSFSTAAGGGDGVDDFEDFEYMTTTFQCTTEQLEEYEEMMKIRQQKEAKKRLLRLKKEAKQAEEEIARKQRADEEARLKKQRDLAEKERQEAMKAEQERQQRLTEKRRLAAERERTRVVHNVRVKVFDEEMAAIAKKVKNVRKKIRDIVELKEKLAKEKKTLDKDQQQKVGRLPELEQELAALLEEENDTAAKNPGPFMPPFDVDPELLEADGVSTASTSAATSAAPSPVPAVTAAATAAAPSLSVPSAAPGASAGATATAAAAAAAPVTAKSAWGGKPQAVAAVPAVAAAAAPAAPAVTPAAAPTPAPAPAAAPVKAPVKEQWETVAVKNKKKK